MEGVLRFNLDDPHEQQRHMRCLLSTKMANVLWEVNNNAYRKLEREGKKSYNSGVLKAIGYVMDLMEEEGININELID